MRSEWVTAANQGKEDKDGFQLFRIRQPTNPHACMKRPSSSNAAAAAAASRYVIGGRSRMTTVEWKKRKKEKNALMRKKMNLYFSIGLYLLDFAISLWDSLNQWCRESISAWLK
jgi:hypothetical protein